MIQLIYISTMRHPISDQECRDILTASRRNNAAADITGLLVVGGNRFLQLLEGPDEAVRATYDRIRADTRHFAAVVLGERTIERRQCGEWAMGYVPGDAPPADGTLEAIVTALVTRIDDKILRAQFLGFARQQSRAA